MRILARLIATSTALAFVAYVAVTYADYRHWREVDETETARAAVIDRETEYAHERRYGRDMELARQWEAAKGQRPTNRTAWVSLSEE
ncbi:hypothetical protein PX52LOC_06506 [Limnoglobus roseus]|uniref:Uncharacterized protein n=1 Tax=Limnoglobus roseus TaxID=2598579 RepID=A0A5C1AQG8_9BACT|nr:hypothetical protein PX52LOC_06506 [Limnoglobus roseus]